jgi:hypothetical protein
MRHHLTSLHESIWDIVEFGVQVLSAFRPRGVPGPTSKLSLRVPAQMGRREMEHKGEQKRGTAARVILRPGRMRSQ